MRWLLPLLVLAVGLLIAPEAPARRYNPLVVFPRLPERLRAVRYARMDRARCLEEAKARQLPFEPVAKHPGVANPVALTGAIRGVRFVRVYEPHSAPERVMDCSLLLALDDLATVASDQGIAEVRYSSIHRKRGRRGGRGHSVGTAIDVNEFVRTDGEILNVLHDFEKHRIGAKTCGDGAVQPKSEKARQFRDLVCALDEAASFNLVLTPHYDYRHRNHLHLEVRRGIVWFLTQ